MSGEYVQYGAGIEALLRSPEVAAMLARKAEKVAAAARSTAPVDEGNYVTHIKVEADATDRAVARVVADVPYAVFVEAKHRTLGSALDAARG